MMDEKKVTISIPWLLPEVKDEQDRCLHRLAEEMGKREGVHLAHLNGDESPAGLCVHYDPNLLSGEEVRRLAQRASSGILGRYHHRSLTLDGLDCSDCALVVEHSLGRMDGVLDVDVNYADQTLHVEYDSRRTNQRAIKQRIRQLGYRVEPGRLGAWFSENRELLSSLGSGVALLSGWLGTTFLGLPPLAGMVFYVLAYLLGGWEIAGHALHSLRERHLDTHLLMVLAALGAAALGELAEGALLLFLFSLGHALEERALERARKAVSALADLAPKQALVQRDGADVLVPVDQVRIGDTVIVAPGVRVPVDGQVLRGRSGVDQSPVTGESLPVDKGPGEPVFAGSVNGEGVLDVRATRLARDSTLARVMKMVEQAQAQKSPTQQLTERFMGIFVPAVLLLDALLIVVPPLFGVPFADSFLRAMTLLVATSPCALALAAPSAILSAVSQAARRGVLVKGGVHLENLGRLEAVAFDKTGTLTVGEPQVTEIISLNGVPEAEVLAWTAAIEGRSAHPLAKAVGRAAQQRGLNLPVVMAVESRTGRGVQAEANGWRLTVGSPALLAEEGIEISKEAQQVVVRLQDEGKSVILLGIDGQAAGLIGLADVVRPEARDTLSALQRIGVKHTVMLTGDNRRAAAHIARQLGLTDYHAELMPDGKLQAISELVGRYGAVGMVGDGVNDAPALANATVGIAMGGARTDVALESADVALMASDLEKLPFAIGLGRATRRVIQQNLVISLSVIVILAAFALLGWAGIGAAVVFHEGSTLVVALNALRLLRYS